MRAVAICQGLVVPKPTPPVEADALDKPARKSRYIPWAELLRRTFAIDIKCGKCGGPFRRIVPIKTRQVIEKSLVAMHLSAAVPELHLARSPPEPDREARDVEDWVN